MHHQPSLAFAAAASSAAALLLALPSTASAEVGIWLPPRAKMEGVSIGGVIDTGIRVQHARGKTTTTMYPNGDETSAFNIRFRENFENGNYVRGFLTAPFKSDSGENTQAANNILFNEAFVTVGGAWGEVAAGRISNIFSGEGDYGLCPQINPSPMGTNFWNASLTPILSTGYKFSNSLVYMSPRVNGFHLGLQYSNGKNGDSGARSQNDEVANVALTYISPDKRLRSALIAGWLDNDSLRSHPTNAKHVKMNAEKNIALMGSYRWTNGWSVHGVYQYFRDAPRLGGSYFYYMGLGIKPSTRGIDGHAVSIGASKLLPSSKLSAVAMANRVKYQGDSAVAGDKSGTRYSLATIYRYYLSKRTHLWAAASLTEGNGIYKKGRDNAIDPTRSRDVGVGLVTHF